MKLVFKCDFCSHTHPSETVMGEHEMLCSFNPINKKCYTCEHAGDEGYCYGYSQPTCDKGLDTVKGRDKGNCEGWELSK